MEAAYTFIETHTRESSPIHFLLSDLPRSVFSYVKTSYQEDPGRSLLELFLVLFMLWYWVAKRYSPGSNEVELTPKEIEQLLDEWEPEPLCKELTDYEKFELDCRTRQVFTGAVGLKLKEGQSHPSLDENNSLLLASNNPNGGGREKLNFAAFNFLGCMNGPGVREKGIETLRKYGVGTCGPRGFYGTLDVHLELEENIALFLGTEAAILYSQGFSCISSVIPAFAKRGDIILADECVNFAIQKGLQISRSTVKYFKHNDMQDLERLMKLVETDRKKKRLPLSRQFIIVEGIYANTGDICPLPSLIALKEKHKYRLMVEESMSLGVLGPRGTGVSDHFGIPATSIDLLVASLTNALGAAGGFCAGSKEIVEHQRLGGQSYVYSASLPAILTVCGLEGIKFVEANPDAVVRLASNSERMYTLLVKGLEGLPLKVDGVIGSPFFHVRMKVSAENRENDERFLQEIVDMAAKDGVILTRAKYVISQERICPPPSIRVSISAGFTRREVEKTATLIKDCTRRVVKSRQQKSFF